MNPISKLLKQRRGLALRAVEQTRDMNEAYLVVHGVMARALGRVSDAERDLGPDLTCALAVRAKRLDALAASL
ncbi:MAG: hypothetical protein K2X34_09965 [Hyphomonadaceae bacterium]|nr:hypothetical protein [Hyphomonadaceae bacterium]